MKPAATIAAVTAAVFVATAMTGTQWFLSEKQPTAPLVARVAKGDRIAEDFAAMPAIPRVIQTIPLRKEQPIPVQDAEPASPPTARPNRERTSPDRGQPSPEKIADAENNGYIRHRDVCARYGGHRIEFMRHRHLMWRCSYSGRRR